MAGERAAAYLSSYFVRRKREKATLSENARNPHLPQVLIWLTPHVTRETGITMPSRRHRRQLWAVRRGLLPPPNWSGVELARTIMLAGPWPVARALRSGAAAPAERAAAVPQRGRGEAPRPA
jgi:hypothetical protein